jgi:hypothetical protein
MVYSLVSLLFPASGILENIKHDVSETGSVSVIMLMGERHILSSLALSKGPN